MNAASSLQPDLARILWAQVYFSQVPPINSNSPLLREQNNPTRNNSNVHFTDNENKTEDLSDFSQGPSEEVAKDT